MLVESGSNFTAQLSSLGPTVRLNLHNCGVNMKQAACLERPCDGRNYSCLLQRRKAANPKKLEPSKARVLGSGVDPAGVPSSVNVSDGIVPTPFSWACEGQPGEVQPTPLFSSQ